MKKFSILLLVLAAVILGSRGETIGSLSTASQSCSRSSHSVSSFLSNQVLLAGVDEARHVRGRHGTQAMGSFEIFQA